MSKTIIPSSYRSPLNLYETQAAIGMIHKVFENNLEQELNLKKVSAPLFVDANTGLNDNLNGVERPVRFDIANTDYWAEVVHSLAKWKRMALHRYGFPGGEGLFTNMNAIRRDEVMDNIHSIYVDQWDWELIVAQQDRTIPFLQNTVTKIVGAICDTQQYLHSVFPALTRQLERTVTFITTQELEDLYPTLSSKERENAITKQYKTVFIMQIGGTLASGEKHDGRAPDYDDWSLNGDLLFWNESLGAALEISSMGIRVDASTLEKQLLLAGCEDRRHLPFHQALLSGKLPLTMGGGIGQSRLCMLLLEKAHVGEVQASIWDIETQEACEKSGVVLL